MSTLSVDTIQGQTTAANVKLPAGAVVQTVSSTMTARVQLNSTGRTAIGAGSTLSITPKFNTSKIYIMTNINCISRNSQSCASYLCRTPSGGSKVTINVLGWYNETNSWNSFSYNHNFIDSPATTTALTYSLEAQITSAADSGIYFNYGNSAIIGQDDGRSGMVALEIAQ